jgi:hypothetical protein
VRGKTALGGLKQMNANKHIRKEKQEQQKRRKPVRKEGHYVESMLFDKPGLTVYVPSADELRAKSDILQPFRGQIQNDEFDFHCTADVGTALMRLIENFGLPNAPEYHDWSEDFMNFKREGTYWEYIFLVNEKHYLFVSHDAEKLIVGCMGAPDRRTCEAFFRFIENIMDLSAEVWTFT